MRFQEGGIDLKSALVHEVSLFLRSVQHFPLQPLLFPLVTYRDFFVLVAQCRNDEPSIDARYTIDSTRRWLELAVLTEQAERDQQQVSDVWFKDEPCQVNLTRRFLSALGALHAGQASKDEVAETAWLLIKSLEVAGEDMSSLGNQPAAPLALLGILLDALAELGWTGLSDSDAGLEIRAAHLLADMIWRKKEETRIAAGILQRLHARGNGFCFDVAAEIAVVILAKITKELDDSCASLLAHGHSSALEIGSIFRLCLNTMFAVDEERAVETIERDLLKPTSALLSTMLERTANSCGDDHLAELDAAATQLFDICYDAARGRPDWL